MARLDFSKKQASRGTVNQHHSVTQVKFWKEKKMKKKSLGTKIIFFGGGKISFFEKKNSKKILEKI